MGNLILFALFLAEWLSLREIFVFFLSFEIQFFIFVFLFWLFFPFCYFLMVLNLTIDPTLNKRFATTRCFGFRALLCIIKGLFGVTYRPLMTIFFFRSRFLRLFLLRFFLFDKVVLNVWFSCPKRFSNTNILDRLKTNLSFIIGNFMVLFFRPNFRNFFF